MQPFILFCFLLSGISSLTLEVVWTRHLEHVFGATTLAISTVLTCFMGGLALGSYAFGRLTDKLKNPLLAYAVAEGVVGISALFIPAVIQGLYPDLNRWMVSHLSNNFLLLSVVRFLAVAVVLAIPTTCMGATLPLLSRHFIDNEKQMGRIGSRIGALYTVNTLGAVFGVFLSAFLLLPGIGLTATNRTAAFINICLCAFIFIFRKKLFARDTSSSSSPEDDEISRMFAGEDEEPFNARPIERNLAMAAFFLSGLASMNLQVVWNRAMAMIIGSSVYSFALVLIAFLVGLASGAAVFSGRLNRIKDPISTLALVEIGVASAAMLNYLYMDDLPVVFAKLVTSQIASYHQHVALIQFLMFTVAALAVFPATFFMGATFPLTIRIVSSGFEKVGKDVGGVYALNTVGAICGSFLSAFVFMPLFSRYFSGRGMQVTFFLSIGIYTAAGVSLLLIAKDRLLHRGLRSMFFAGLTIAFLFGAPKWDNAALTIGIFRLSLMRHALGETWGEPDIRYYYDGVSTTVSVEVWGHHYALKNNGKVDASNGDDMPTQIMVAAYPLLLHPKGPKNLDVAIVGVGSGVTVGSALEFPVRHVDAVELENAVVEASRSFGAMQGTHVDSEFNVNHLTYRKPDDPKFKWSDPSTYIINDRLTVFNNDGRNFLASSPTQYDIIISEPSNPWITGVSNMFTADNFRSAASALKKDGLFCQWVQLYEMSPENIKTIFRTFASVFPYTALFSAENLSSDTMMLGSFSPIDLDLARVERTMADPRVKTELERGLISSAADVLGRVLLVDRDELIHYTNGPKGDKNTDLPINTDDNAHIEFRAPHDLISYSKFAGYLSTIYTSQWSFGRLSGVIQGLGDGEAKLKRLTDQALSMLVNGRKAEAERFIRLAKNSAPKADPTVARTERILRLLTGKEKAPPPLIEDPTPSPTMTSKQADSLKNQIEGVMHSIDSGAYKDALDRFLAIEDHLWRRGGPQMMLLKGYLHFLNAAPEDGSECEEAIEIFDQLIREHGAYVARHPESYCYLSLCHETKLHFDKAVKNIRTYVGRMEDIERLAALAEAQAKVDLDAALAGMEGTVPVGLPKAALGSPTTDGQEESKKDFR
jgi:spermidine synthase